VDHDEWARPEQLKSTRPSYKLDAEHPGSDLVGETSAALASASIVYRETDPQYADLLLEHAKQLYEFADKHR